MIMKKLSIILLFVLFSLNGYSQITQEERDSVTSSMRDAISSSDVLPIEYCQIVGTAKGLGLSGKLIISIDFGQEQKFFSAPKDIYLFDEGSKKPKVFNSMIDALNFMVSNRWEFEFAYVITVGNSNVYHFLLKRYKY
ncbi:hypothetical protein ES705_37536 [subsurface metagenome]